MKFKNADKKIKAGEYRIENIKDINSLISILEKGQEKLIKYTIPEGFDIEKIAERLSDLNLVNKDEFLDLALKRGNEFDFKFSSEIKNGNLEGFLFPDTYLISEPDAKKVILQMLSGFENIFDEKIKYLPGNIRILRLHLHSFRCSLHMHQYIGYFCFRSNF